MNYANIKFYDVANGPGIRVSLFVSGCRLHCPECFNKEAQNFHYGKNFTEEVKNSIFSFLDKNFAAGLTILGGEPFEPENQLGLVEFIAQVREKYPHKTIWMYSGYTLDTLPHTPYTEEILSNIDVLVDGPFIAAQKNIKLPFCGSENQRLIDMPRTLAAREVVLWQV